MNFFTKVQTKRCVRVHTKECIVCNKKREVSKLFTMKVRPSKLANYHLLARSHNMTLSKMIKDFLDGKKLPKQKIYRSTNRFIKTVDPKLIREISAIGNNLNQISRRVNSREIFDVRMSLVSIEKKLERLLDAR